jgi:hypothetical protein
MIFSWSQDLQPPSAIAATAVALAEDKKAKHLQIGSYSATANTLGISQYVWTNLL